MGTIIAGTGSYLPSRVVPNCELEKELGLPENWIFRRTGIIERRYADQETVLSMAIEASVRAIGEETGDIGLVVAHSSTRRRAFPSMANEVSGVLGIKPKIAFDIASGCVGFLQGFLTATSYMERFKIDLGLVVASEELSRYVDTSDRDTSILFGDGAGAVLLKKCRGTDVLLESDSGTEGALGDSLSLEVGTEAKMRMNGGEVYKFAVRTLVDSVRRVLERSVMTVNDVDALVPHQSNGRILQAANKHLGFPEERILSDLAYLGNTGSASIPITLDRANRQGIIAQGDTLLFVSYGAGMSWSTVLTEWISRREDHSCILKTAFQGY